MNNDILFNYFKLIHDNLNKFEFKLSDKNKIYIPLFSSSIEHCMSIVVLNKENLTTSMYALIRPAVESFLRAMWVKYCDEAGSLNDDLTSMHFPKKIEHLIEVVTKEVPELESSHFLKTVLELTFKNMHDFTHGGIQSIARQYNSDEDVLTNLRDDDEIESILKLSVLISSLSYQQKIQDHIGAEQLSLESVNDLAKEIIGL
jgi:hypothetical protein